MNEIIRYCVKMKNGDFMKQDFNPSNINSVIVSTVDNPIDSTLFKSKEVTLRCINETLNGNSNLPILFDDSNPPIETVELKIKY